MPNRLEYYKSTKAICARLASGAAGPTLARSIKYRFEDFGTTCPMGPEIEVRMVQRDVTDVLSDDAADGLNPLVVNPTGTQSCGEWEFGTDSFEESLAYRTTLSMSLQDDAYPIRRDECVYSPHVSVFRDARYGTRKSFQVAVVSLTPPVRAEFSIENDRARMLATLAAAFQVAIKHGHQSVVFNAFGCHDDNNPSDVAQLMGEIITRYSRSVRRVTVVLDFETSSPSILVFRKNMKWTVLDTPD